MAITQRTIRITHVITGLNTGGAEMMLYKLLQSVDKDRFSSSVISMTGLGEIGNMIQSLGVPVIALGMRPGELNLQSFRRLSGEIKAHQPDVVQTWMYHADLLGGLAAKSAGLKIISWNLRNSTLSWRTSKITTLVTVGICSLLSHFLPTSIAVCSTAAERVHIRVGYSRQKMRVIPNGFDLSAFKPDLKYGKLLREKLNIPLFSQVVGLAARFDEQKDHRTFFKSAGLLLKQNPRIHFLLCGEGITLDNPVVHQWVKASGNSQNFHLLGRWTNMPEFHNACDVSVSSSAYGESFSNVLGEAMACGVPCVATNVGGAEEVLGDTGGIVPPGDADKLAKKIAEILDMPVERSAQLGSSARKRVMENFSIEKVADLYEEFWQEIQTQNDL